MRLFGGRRNAFEEYVNKSKLFDKSAKDAGPPNPDETEGNPGFSSKEIRTLSEAGVDENLDEVRGEDSPSGDGQEHNPFQEFVEKSETIRALLTSSEVGDGEDPDELPEGGQRNGDGRKHNTFQEYVNGSPKITELLTKPPTLREKINSLFRFLGGKGISEQEVAELVGTLGSIEEDTRSYPELTEDEKKRLKAASAAGAAIRLIFYCLQNNDTSVGRIDYGTLLEFSSEEKVPIIKIAQKYFEKFKDPTYLRAFFEAHKINDKDNLDFDLVKNNNGGGFSQSPDWFGMNHFGIEIDRIRYVGRVLSSKGEFTSTIQDNPYLREVYDEVRKFVSQDPTGRNYIDAVLIPRAKNAYINALAKDPNESGGMVHYDESGAFSPNLSGLFRTMGLGYPSFLFACHIYDEIVDRALDDSNQE